MLERQDDVTIIAIKDYIKAPKEKRLPQLHMIVEVPVFFSSSKKNIRVEVQIRTIDMDFWASLDHQLKYKKQLDAQEADRDRCGAEKVRGCHRGDGLQDVKHPSED